MRNLFYFFTKVNYKEVISLGYNCEVSFYIRKFCNKLNSSLFSWAYVFGIESLLKALNDLDNLFTKNISEPAPLYKDKDFNIAFHGNLPDLDLINPEIKFSDEVLEADRKNTFEKIAYLKEKFKKVLSNNKRKIIFYKTRYDDIDKKDCFHKLYDILKKYGKNFKLIIIVENKDLEPLKNLEKENLFFRGVEQFNPEEHSDNDTYKNDWFKIFQEFNIKRGKNNE